MEDEKNDSREESGVMSMEETEDGRSHSPDEGDHSGGSSFLEDMDVGDGKNLTSTPPPPTHSPPLEELGSPTKEEAPATEGENAEEPSATSSPTVAAAPTKDAVPHKSRKVLEEEEREKMQVLVSNFTEEQLDRYEMYRRAAFPKAAIRRIMQSITCNNVSTNAVIAMSGLAKVYVGEVVEEALDVMEQWGESGPVQPKHLREAVRRLRRRGIAGSKPTLPFYR